MESHGVAGRVQISAETADFPDGDFDVEARGEIEIKGKGMMMVYLLNGEKAAAVAQAI